MMLASPHGPTFEDVVFGCGLSTAVTSVSAFGYPEV
jgi:hypothetical protein